MFHLDRPLRVFGMLNAKRSKVCFLVSEWVLCPAGANKNELERINELIEEIQESEEKKDSLNSVRAHNSLLGINITQ